LATAADASRTTKSKIWAVVIDKASGLFSDTCCLA
jgi:hypothetical protein